jgi:hypothetical protein
MTPEERAAYVIGQSICALAEIEAMKAANRERLSDGKALAYDEAAFFAVQDTYCISHNAVISLFHGG